MTENHRVSNENSHLSVNRNTPKRVLSNNSYPYFNITMYCLGIGVKRNTLMKYGTKPSLSATKFDYIEYHFFH